MSISDIRNIVLGKQSSVASSSGNTQRCLNKAQAIRTTALAICKNDFECMQRENSRADRVFNQCFQSETGSNPDDIPTSNHGVIGVLNKQVDDYVDRANSGESSTNPNKSAAHQQHREYLLRCAVRSFNNTAAIAVVNVTNQCDRDIMVHLCVKNARAGWQKRGTPPSGLYVPRGATKEVYRSGFDNNQTASTTDERSFDYKFSMQVTGRLDENQTIIPCERVVM